MPRVNLHVEGAVATLTLTRPEARNAVDMEMRDELRAALRQIENDPAIRCAILTGAGSVFCAGMDLATFLGGQTPGITEVDRFAGLVGAKRAKPLIAAVNGPALAGGMEIMLACDMVVAVETARFGLPEPHLGLFAAGGGAFRLPRRISPIVAAQLLLTGDAIEAGRAYELGLVNAVVSGDQLMPTALQWASRIAQVSPGAIAATLAILQEARSEEERAGWAITDRYWAEIVRSADAQEGPRAFLDKRRPNFSGT